MDLSAILKDQQALYAFMQFLKDEDAMNQLQFCLSVEDFNKRMMTPDLSDADLKSLHSEATDLHKMYLKQGAPSAVGVSQELAKEIQRSKRTFFNSDRNLFLILTCFHQF